MRTEVAALTPMQHKAMLLVCEGHSNKVVGGKLGISEHTAKMHIQQAMKRLGATTRTLAAVRFALQEQNREAVTTAVAAAVA